MGEECLDLEKAVKANNSKKGICFVCSMKNKEADMEEYVEESSSNNDECLQWYQYLLLPMTAAKWEPMLYY